MDNLEQHTQPIPGTNLLQITDVEGFLAELKAIVGPRLNAERAIWEKHGPALEQRMAEAGIAIDTFGGNCPVQMDGTIDGKCFYFRARGAHWSFGVGEDPGDAIDGTLFYHDQEYGEWPDAGWMTRVEAAGFVLAAAELWRARNSAC